MKIISTYPTKIKESSGAFEATAVLYRQAVDYFIGIMLKHWDGSFSAITNSTFVVRATELLCWPTAKRPLTKYDFGKSFYKFPCYLRRAAINDSLRSGLLLPNSIKAVADKSARKRTGATESWQDFPCDVP